MRCISWSQTRTAPQAYRDVALTLASVNDAPTIDLNGEADGTGYETTPDSASGVLLFGSQPDIADIDSANIKKAIITVAMQPGDEIMFSSQPNGLNHSPVWLPDGRMQITITGIASLAVYEAALADYTAEHGGSLDDREVTLVVWDAEGASSNTVTSIIHAPTPPPPPNEAPVIHTEVAYTYGDETDTTLAGLSVTDAEGDENPGEQFTVTATAQYGTLSVSEGNSQTEITFHNSLQGINNKLGNGITYTNGTDDPETTDDDNDTVTLTVTDGNGGSDTVNFRFSVFGETGATLTGNGDKDVLFGTGHDDVLTGNDNADTFVFDNHGGFEDIGHDTVMDFKIGEDENRSRRGLRRRAHD